MTVTKTHELPNFRRLMREVQHGDMTPEGAASIIDEYIKAEVAHRTMRSLDVELGLHPLNTVQTYADRLSRDQDRFGDRMVSTLVREYAMLRRRLADDHLRTAAAMAPVPAAKLPPKLQNAEQQLFAALRDMGRANGESPDK